MATLANADDYEVVGVVEPIPRRKKWKDAYRFADDRRTTAQHARLQAVA